jgi:hypothetical protein
MFEDGPLATFGTTQLIDAVLAIPGRLLLEQNRLVEVQLNGLHPYAATVAMGLERLVQHFGTPLQR